MAAPTLTLNVNHIRYYARHKEIEYTLQMNGGTDVTGATGETLDLTKALNPKNLGRALLDAKDLPANEDIHVDPLPLGFNATISKNPSNATLANYLFCVYKSMGTPQDVSYNSTLCPPALADAPKIVFRIKQKKFN